MPDTNFLLSYLKARGGMAPIQNPPVGARPMEAAQQGQMNAMFNRNRQYAVPLPSYTTQLDPASEAAFRTWVTQKRVPFDPNEPTQDYDMRGYWRDVASRGASETGINANDGQLHYPDTYKTPYHQSFSGESQYAKPGGPVWINDYQLADPRTGQVLFDERAQRR